MRSALASLVFLALLLPIGAAGQSAQRFSLQFSALGSAPFGGGVDQVAFGPGWEAQIRVNPSLWSFGFGVEQTLHGIEGVDDRDVTFLGGFFEPRLVVDIGSDRAAPYLSARFAVSQTTLTQQASEATATGFTVNGGGGLLVRLSGRINLDLGVTLGYKKLGQVEIESSTIDLGSGANAIGRVGLAVGLGS
jgi:hypothetical protein